VDVQDGVEEDKKNNEKLNCIMLLSKRIKSTLKLLPVKHAFIVLFASNFMLHYWWW